MKLRGKRCQCTECGGYFNSLYAFEKHKIGKVSKGTRRCRTEAEMLNAGMIVNNAGYWCGSARFPQEELCP